MEDNFKNRVFFGDCLAIMPKIQSESIDMVLCDLPYGMVASLWDCPISLDILWAQYKRIIKNNGSIVLFASQPFTTKLINSNLKDFKYCWYWIKNQGTNFFHAKRMPIRKVEEICVFYGNTYFPQKTQGHAPTNSAIGSHNGDTYHGKKKRNYIGGSTERYPTNILEYPCVNNYSKLHNAQKPLELIEYLIKTYSNENDVVLDNCAGSFTTAVACDNLKRNWICIEKEEKFCNIGLKRVNDNRALLEIPHTTMVNLDANL